MLSCDEDLQGEIFETILAGVVAAVIAAIAVKYSTSAKSSITSVRTIGRLFQEEVHGLRATSVYRPL